MFSIRLIKRKVANINEKIYIFLYFLLDEYKKGK
jgi:hypothetical protein